MIIENPKALKSWLVGDLDKLRVKNHAAHAKHVFAQLKKEKSETELRQSIWKKLFPVLYGKAKKFIDKLFITLENKSYLQFEPLSSKVNEKILKTDMPERMQLRKVPIITSVEEGSAEFYSEAKWIYKKVFFKSLMSNQDGTADGREMVIKETETVEKIRLVLEFIRNHHFEIPYIANYLKEYVLPLSVNDLWSVYKSDEEWTKLQYYIAILMPYFIDIKRYQSEKLTESIPENVRVLKDEDIDRLRMVKSREELSAVLNHFILYYGNDVPAMLEKYLLRESEEAKEDGEPMDANELKNFLLDPDHVNLHAYYLCARARLYGLLKKYALSPEQLAENMRDNYQQHKVNLTQTEPLDDAALYSSPEFPTASEVLKAANYMLAVQIAKEPLVLQCVRELFFERARIDVIPTEKGWKEIDENHNLYPMKFLKDKPACDLVDDQFLRLMVAEKDGLLTIVFQTKIEGAKTASYVDEIKALFTQDRVHKYVEEWNVLHNEIIDLAISTFVLPTLVKELKAKLLYEAREFVKRACCQQLYNWIKVAPFEVNFGDKKGWDTENGIRVLGLSFGANKAVFGCLINGDGERSNRIHLKHILAKRKNAEKVKDLKKIKNFISSHKPHVIAVSANSLKATKLVEDLRAIIAQLVKDEKWPTINVELVDNSLAKVFAKSTRAKTEFPQHLLYCEAIMIARVVQDALIAYSQLCNADEDILRLQHHPLQDQLSKEELLEGLYLEFVNRTNEVGVDINRAIKHPHTANLVQFVCGLGPFKSEALIQTLKQNNQRLENRSQLETACHMGPKVLANCAGFIKIGKNSMGDGAESSVEVLDGSRVHPDGRSSYQPLSDEDIFFVVIKETPKSFYKGKIVSATVRRFKRRKPKRGELDRANPNRNEATGLWQCPFCLQNDFTDASKAWEHLRAGSCSGQVGVRMRLENGLSGFLPMTCLSDSEVKHPEEHVRVGKKIQCRITKINFEDFSVDLTSKPSDLMDINGAWRPPKDPFYDQPAEDAMLKAEKDSKERRQSNTERVIVHPASNPVTTVSVQPPPILVVSAPSIDPRANTTSNTTERRSRSPTSRSRSRSPPNRDRDRTAHHSKSRDRSIPNQQPGCSSRDDRRQGGGSPGSSKSYRTSSSPLPPQRSSRSTRSPIPQAPVVAAKDYILVAPSLRSMPIGATPTNQASKGVTKGKSIVIPTVATISVQPLPSLVVSAPSIDPRANTQSDTTERRSRSPTSRSRSRSPNRDRDRTARRYRDHATIGSSNRRNDRSRSPSSRPSPPLPPVVAPAPANFFPLIPLEVFQCAYSRRECPRGDLCPYDHGEPPDLVLLKLLSYISG